MTTKKEKTGLQPDGTLKYVSSGPLGTVIGPGPSWGIKKSIDKLEAEYGPEKGGYSEGVAYQQALLETWLPRSSWGKTPEDIDSIAIEDIDPLCEALTRYLNPRLWEQMQEIERRMKELESAEGNA